jgi:hypothetical protein
VEYISGISSLKDNDNRKAPPNERISCNVLSPVLKKKTEIPLKTTGKNNAIKTSKFINNNY